MSTSKFAGLEGVEFDTPDVYETRSPSPSRKKRGPATGRARGYGSSDEDDLDSDEDGSLDNAASQYRKNKKVGPALIGEQQDSGHQAATDNDLVKTHIDVERAAQRFRDATEVTSKGVDFTAAIHRRRKDKKNYYPRTAATFETNTYFLGSGTGYRSANDDAADDDVETEDNWVRVRGAESMVDRFRRLRFETEELQKELQGNSSNDDVHEKEDAMMAEPTRKDLLSQLHFLREQLEVVQDSNEASLLAHKTPTVRWQSETRRLLAKLREAQYEENEVRNGVAEEAIITDEAGLSKEFTQQSNIDGRLKALESLIGVESASQEEAKSLPRPLLPALARIEHLLTLFTQPRHLDGISRRIKVLVSELERAHEAKRRLTVANANNGDGEGEGDIVKAASLSKETLARLNTALPLLARIEPMLPILPSLLNRLQSLASLHTSSASIASDVDTMEGVLRSSTTRDQEMTELVKNMERTLQENEERAKDNLASIQERMDKLLERMDSLTR